MKNLAKARKEGGITLIALVVTIIILLVLAGVTLSLVLGDGGLINTAKKGIEEHDKASQKEKEDLTGAAGMIQNLIDGLGSTGGTTPQPPTPPTPPVEIGSSEVAENLKEYQGKYVDIGLDVDGYEGTTNDWEIFYATDDRIFLIAADYVPTSKLDAWNIIGNSASENNGFEKYDENYCVRWKSAPTSFKTLPKEPANFLSLVMHTQYDLNSNSDKNNSKAVSYLLDTTAWNGIKEAATKNAKIDFVIGGPTLEMWCAAWKEAIKEDTNGFVEIKPEGTNTSGYYVSSEKLGMQNMEFLYMDGTQTELGDKLTTLGEKYKTFFPHTSRFDNCFGYRLASPSAKSLLGSSDYLFRVDYDGSVGRHF